MKTYSFSELTESRIAELTKRPSVDIHGVIEKITPIIDEVKNEGDAALQKYTEKFDGVAPDPISRPVRKPEEFNLPEDVTSAFDTAYRNIFKFHKAQYPSVLQVETMPGVSCSRIPRPIERVGLYIPGGTAVLPSSTLMLGTPAQIAGCKEIVLVTPPRPDGSISPEVEYCAHKTGATKIVLAGGAQAIAALAYGTESVPKVDKIFGPGNQFVTAAKMLLLNSDAMVGMDLPAGPSEVLVIADETAEPSFVAADLLSQAEHGADSQVIMVGTGNFNYDELNRQINQQLELLPRHEVAAKALQESFIVQTDSTAEAVSFSNRYAPEHLIINTKDPNAVCEEITHAGSVFLGQWSPESVGDYASGTNHTLPTYGFAKMYSGVSLADFFTFITAQNLTKEGLKSLAPAVTKMAEVEELEAHKRAVTIRLDENETKY